MSEKQEQERRNSQDSEYVDRDRRRETIELEDIWNKLAGITDRVSEASGKVAKHDMVLLGMSARMEVMEGYEASILMKLGQLTDGKNGIVNRLAVVEANSEADRDKHSGQIKTIHERITLHIKWPAWIFGGAALVLTVFVALDKLGIL